MHVRGLAHTLQQCSSALSEVRRTVRVVNGGRHRAGAAHGSQHAHSSQLTAHSSQLTAHSSQLTAQWTAGHVCTEPVVRPCCSALCGPPHARGAMLRASAVCAWRSRPSRNCSLALQLLPRSAALRLSADGAPGREACSCARSRSEACGAPSHRRRRVGRRGGAGYPGDQHAVGAGCHAVGTSIWCDGRRPLRLPPPRYKCAGIGPAGGAVGSAGSAANGAADRTSLRVAVVIARQRRPLRIRGRCCP